MDITWGVSASHHLPWHWLIAVYLFLAGVSGGAFLTAALTDMYSNDHNIRIIRTGAYIAPISIIIGLVLLVFDLGRPLHFWKLLINVNAGSVMSIGVFIISIFSGLAAVYGGIVWLASNSGKRITKGVHAAADEIAATGKGIQSLRKPVAILGSLFAVGTATYTGFLLSAVTTNGLWHVPFLGIQAVPFLPILFLVSAMSAGLAATLIGAGKSEITIYKKIDLVFIVLELILLAILYASIKSVFFSGTMGTIFWLGVVAIGLVVPFFLTVYSLAKHKSVVVPVSAMIVVGGLCLRFFVVYSGQMFK